MKIISKILIAVSLFFVGWYIIKNDLFDFPKKIKVKEFTFSVLLLLLGHLSIVYNWKAILFDQGAKVSWKLSFVSIGLNSFMKYIPGKVMSVLGRAQFVAEYENLPLRKTSHASLVYQLLDLLVGGLLGGLFIFQFELASDYLMIFSAFIFIILLILFSLKPLRILAYKLGRKFGKRILIPKISLVDILKSLPRMIVTWLFWSAAFYFYCISFGANLNLMAGFFFPFAMVLGIAAIFSPGGIGVREGVLVFGLTLANVPVELATTIAVFSRLWFIFGEVIIFFTALAIQKNISFKRVY